MSDSIQQQALPKHISRVNRRRAAALEFHQVHLVPAPSKPTAWLLAIQLVSGSGKVQTCETGCKSSKRAGGPIKAPGLPRNDEAGGDRLAIKSNAGRRSSAFRVQLGVKLRPRLA